MSPLAEPHVSSPLLSEQYENAINLEDCTASKRDTQVISVDVDADNEANVLQLTGVAQADAVLVENRKDDINEAEFSDEEFPELAAQARERARRTRLKAIKPKDRSSGSMNPVNDMSLPGLPNSAPPPNPVIQILITSRIPNTEPLIVNRRLAQRLKDVRLAWCSRQGFDDHTTRDIFLTWRGKRLFDFTTCESLGIELDPEGNLETGDATDEFSWPELDSEGNLVIGVLANEFSGPNRIHMEAMTTKLFDEDRQRRLVGVQATATEENIQSNDSEKDNSGGDDKITIILKAKNYAEFQITIDPVGYRKHCIKHN
jgi:hypothetical protein